MISDGTSMFTVV